MEKRKSTKSVINTVFLSINLTILIGLTIYNLIVKDSLLRLYASMDIPLPMVTLLMLSKGHFIFITFSFILIIKEAIKQKGVTCAINIISFILVLALLLLYYFALTLPKNKL